MLHAILSSQLHVIFMPPVHFSNFIVQRGIIMPVMAGFMVGIVVPMPMPGIIMPEVIGFIVAVVIEVTPLAFPSAPPTAGTTLATARVRV